MGKVESIRISKAHAWISFFIQTSSADDGAGGGASFRLQRRKEISRSKSLPIGRPLLDVSTRRRPRGPCLRPVCRSSTRSMDISAAETSFGARGVGFELPIVLRDREFFFLAFLLAWYTLRSQYPRFVSLRVVSCDDLSALERGG